MFSVRSLATGLPSFLSSWRNFSNDSPAVDVPSVEIHNLDDDRRDRGTVARRLDQFIRSNHLSHSTIYHNLQFHNHAPHILGSAYLLGADQVKLGEIYDEESKLLEPWTESPGEISQDDWRDFLGKRNYQRAYVDFFEDRKVELGYSWKDLLDEFLFEGDEPLINNIFCGLAHPVIHLAYAYELSHEHVAVEALALAACFYDNTNKYLNDPAFTKPAPRPSSDLIELLNRFSADTRLQSLHSQVDEASTFFQDPESEAVMLEYWNSWTLADPTKQFRDSQRAAVALLVATVSGRKDRNNFYICHALTSSHAVRTLLPLLPPKWHISLVRQWWLFALSAHLMEHRPKIELDRILKYDLAGRGWDYVVKQALTSKWSSDAHFVKACRAMKVSAETWGDDDQFYLKAAVRFAANFDDWAF